MNYTFQQSAKHKSALDQLTIKCTCAERIAPHEYDNHMERCSSVTFVCPHSVCREKVIEIIRENDKYSSFRMKQQCTILNNLLII